MGTCQCGKRNKIQLKNQILIVGLPHSGKTSIFFQLTDHPQFRQPVPTIGFNLENILYNDLNITLVDSGQNSDNSPTPRNYLATSKGLIFVVDGSNKDQLKAASQRFNQIMRYKQAPTLIYLTKQDISVTSERDISKSFGLKNIKQPFRVQPCTGINGQGVHEGFEWLFKTLYQRK